MPAILCIFAHPDDESFGPAGTIARYAAQGVPVHLLTYTRGQRGVRHDPIDSPEALGSLREYELRAAVRVLGIASLTLLDYMDGELDQAGGGELVAHAVEAIERTGADTIITFGPLGITRHGDHIAAHRAAMAAAAQVERELQVYYMAIEGPFAEQFKLEGPEIDVTHRIDIADFFETKLAALACHSSQQDSREFFLMLTKERPAVEWYHRAVPPADGSGATDLFGYASR